MPCRKRTTVVAPEGGQTLDNPVCSVAGFDLTLSCETAGGGGAVTNFVELSPPEDNSAIATDGLTDAFTESQPSDADVDASDSKELVRTNSISGGNELKISRTVSIVATTPTGKTLNAQLALITELIGTTGNCTVAVALDA